MKRRRFLASVTVAGVIALAGCSDDNNEPPPRKSNVIDSVSVTDGALEIVPEPDDEQWVRSRRELDGATAITSIGGDPTRGAASTVDTQTISRVRETAGSLSPIGRVSARKGRGATKRTSGSSGSVPRTSKGRRWYGGGPYTRTWYSDHDDEVHQYPVEIQELGVAYFGSDQAFENRSPGPGPVNWDTIIDDPDRPTTVEIVGPGWHRVGAHIVAEDSVAGPNDPRDFGWEAIDLKATRSDIDKKWKVSPRI